MCGVAGAYGRRLTSATTRPCRTSMKLFIASMPVSAAWTKASTEADETPSCSGVLRGSGAVLCAARRVAPAVSSAMTTKRERIELAGGGWGGGRGHVIRQPTASADRTVPAATAFEEL